MINFEKFKTLVRDYVNIDLFAYKDEQLHRRLTSFFLKNNITDIDEYVKNMAKDDKEKEKFLDFVTINVTEFYRNPELYDKLSEVLVKDGHKNLKIWSAACSNGAEPYSIAMLLLEKGFTEFRIYATDLDPTIIRKAKDGIYEKEELINLPSLMVTKYFEKNENKYHISNFIKSKVVFKVHDLLMDDFDRNYDLILCRNVVIYFNTDAKDKLYSKLSKSLNEGGLLFVGATENIYEYSHYGLEKMSSFIYRKI